MTRGAQTYRGFTLDNVLHSSTEGDIHFNLYVPGDGASNAETSQTALTAGESALFAASVESTGRAEAGQAIPAADIRNARAKRAVSTARAGNPNARRVASTDNASSAEAKRAPLASNPSQPCALFVTLPGYQGLYFQGVGENIRTEDFGFEAQAYDPSMIVVAPQLSDWGETSARQTIALVEWLLRACNIDPNRVFLEGYSGGGETLSHVMGLRPELFRAALHCSSQWDDNVDALARARVPVRLVIGESDEYYGADPARQAAEQMRAAYRAQGLAESDIDELVTLDVKPASYFAAGGATNQHGGGAALFSHDPEIMGWLFKR